MAAEIDGKGSGDEKTKGTERVQPHNECRKGCELKQHAPAQGVAHQATRHHLQRGGLFVYMNVGALAAPVHCVFLFRGRRRWFLISREM